MGRESDEKALERLSEWEKSSLPEPIELYARLTRLQIEAKSKIGLKKAQLQRDIISERLSLFSPILRFDDLALDWKQVERIYTRALSIIGEYSTTVATDPSVSLKQIAREWYNGTLLKEKGMGDDPVVVAIHTAIKPFLSKHAESLLPNVDQGKWRQGYCPICGGRPNFAFLKQEPEGSRWLICARCDAEWLFQRLECPFCGNKEQKRLAYFTDDNGLYRLYVCEKCKGYIKAVDLRRTQTEVLPQLEWVATLDLDRQACEMGYGVADLAPVTNNTRAQ